jgi:hypothetical protein
MLLKGRVKSTGNRIFTGDGSEIVGRGVDNATPPSITQLTFPRSAPSSTMKMEAEISSETSSRIYQDTGVMLQRISLIVIAVRT